MHVVLFPAGYTRVMAYFYNSLGLRFNEMKEVYVYGEWEAIYNQSVVEGIVNS